MTDEDVLTAALSDPDGQPLTQQDLACMKRVPRIKVIRRALRLTPEQFADHYRIPADTVRAWEAGTATPDAVAEAYLRVIAAAPAEVTTALTEGVREAAE